MTPEVMALIPQNRRAESGFSLVELMIVLLAIAILMIIGIASYLQMTRIANDKRAHADLLTAVKVQALHRLDNNVFTADQAALFDLEPTLRYTADGDPEGTIVVKIEAGSEATDVCLFTQTLDGRWFAIHHSTDTGDRFAESSPIDCTAGNVSGWSAESW